MILQKKHVEEKYNDLPIQVCGSFWISYLIDAIGRPESVFERITTSYFYVDLLSGFLITFLLWEYLKRVVMFLDLRFEWFKETGLRLIFQLVLGFVVPSFFSFVLTYWYMKLIWNQDIFISQWLQNEFYVVQILLAFVNFYYFTYWLYLMNGKSTLSQISVQGINKSEIINVDVQKGEGFELKSAVIEVPKGGKNYLMPVSDMAYAYVKDNYSYIKQINNETFVTSYSLEDLYGMLDNNNFFRVNRQFIVNRKALKSYSSIENGKIEVEIDPISKDKIIISQKRAKAFREWIR